jgi:hypothetical protein
MGPLRLDRQINEGLLVSYTLSPSGERALPPETLPQASRCPCAGRAELCRVYGAASHTVWSKRWASAVEDRQVEPAEARRVYEDVDLDDLSPPDREAHDRERPPTRSHDDPRGPVHEYRSHERGEP